MKRVSVNLLGYNDRRYIDKCLGSLLAQTYSPLDILFIDNRSTDGSAEHVEENFPGVEVIRYSEDPDARYAKVHNFGIDRARGDYVLIMNVDIFMAPDAIEELVRALERSPRRGSASGKIYQTDERFEPTRIFDTTGIFLRRDRRVPDRGWGEEDHGQYDREEEIFSPTGAITLYRREMLDDVRIGSEYFDEDFVSYREEADLNWRAKLYGWESVYVPTSVAWHDRTYSHRTRRNISRETRRLVFRNRYLMMIKNESPRCLIRDLPNILLFEALAFGYALLREPFLLPAYLEVIRLAPRMWRKRREICRRTVISPAAMRRFIR
jgi:GT2 family glycosyltransferase